MNVKDMLLGIHTMIPIGLTSALGQIVAGDSTTSKAWDLHTMRRQSPQQTVARDIVASHRRDHTGECRAIQHDYLRTTVHFQKESLYCLA